MISNLAPPDSTPSLISPIVSPNLLSDRSPLKLGVMVSGNGSNFEAVAEAIALTLRFGSQYNRYW
jgi:phosphoribosylglycinamide formyltransferase-1